MNQEYPVNPQNHQTQEKPHPIVTTSKRAEQYSTKELEDKLRFLEERGLRNTAPYRVFRELLEYLKEKR